MATHPMNTTRGVPFDPDAAKERRQGMVEAARALDLQAKAEAHKQEMRALGRRLDEEARQARRERRRQVDQAWRERWDRH